MSIRSRLLLLATAMLLPYLLYVGISTYAARQDAIAHALSHNEAEARRVAAQFAAYVEQVQALLASVETAVSDDITAVTENDNKLKRLLAAVPGAVSWVSIVDPAGNITSSSAVPLAQRTTVNLSDRDYFRAAVRTRAFAVSTPIVARTTGELIVIMAHPMLDAAQSVRAVAVAVIGLGRLGELAESMRGEPGSRIALASDRGMLMLHTPVNREWIGRDARELPQFGVARSGGTFRGETRGLDGERLYGASVPVRNAPWQAFYAMPYEAALAPAQKRLFELLSGAAIMLLVAVGAAWWISRGLVMPILRLRRGVNALARGHLAHRVDVSAGGEVAALAYDINAMARKLGEAERRLRSLAALSSDFFWETDLDQTFSRLEGDLQRVLGMPIDQALHKPVWELGLRVNGDLAAHMATLERREPFRDVEFVRVAQGGAIAVVLLVSGEPRTGANGEFLGYRGVARDVTERNLLEAEVRRAQRSLARSEERFRSVVEMSSDWIWETDPQHRFTYVSSGLERTLDLPAAEIIGKARWEKQFENMRPGDWDAHRALLEQRLPFSDLRLESINRAGRRTVQSVSGQPVFGPAKEFLGYRGVGRDITAQLEVEEALRSEHDRLARVLEAMAEGLLILDAGGRYALLNAAGERILGARREEIVGRRFTDVPWSRAPLEGEDGSTPESVFELMRAGREWHFGPENYVLKRADGVERVLRHQAARMEDSAGAFAGIIVTFEDITEQLQEAEAHERQILELNADLERRVVERTAELTVAYKEMESFSYSVSHDLRAPLRAISGFSRILLEDFRGEFPAEAQRLLGRVAQNAERMGALIDGLLEFGRLSRQPLRLQRIRPAELVREVLDELAALREGRRIDLRVGDMPECEADRVLLKQVYANLLANAIKYTGLRPEAKIEVGSITMGLGPVYYVRDNGTGFDMAYAGKLFAMFERLHLPAEFEGNGVGLALVRRIVERHGGKVWADSAPDKGATFFFRLGDEAPAAQAGEGKAAA
jgi:PAS domain S-box-containing protein